jgi:hypothetical protein
VLGFAPHSGWAAVVMLGGTRDAPRVLTRERLEMTDASLEGSKQPYHALEGLPLPEARRRLALLEASAAALAADGLHSLIARARSEGAEARAAGILDSAGHGGSSLEAILASHALIHSADGQHFRAALAQGCQALGLSVSRVPQRELTGRAAAALEKTPDQLGTAVASLGRGLGAPWGADQKAAALLAWLLLATTH